MTVTIPTWLLIALPVATVACVALLWLAARAFKQFTARSEAEQELELRSKR